MKAQKRYEVVVRAGRRIVERHWFDDYDAAMAKLDELEDDGVNVRDVEFTDHQLFTGKYR